MSINNSVTNKGVALDEEGSNEREEEQSLASNDFVKMLWYYLGDGIQVMFGKRKQEDGNDEAPTSWCSVSLTDQQDISPISSPYFASGKKSEQGNKSTTFVTPSRSTLPRKCKKPRSNQAHVVADKGSPKASSSDDFVPVVFSGDAVPPAPPATDCDEEASEVEAITSLKFSTNSDRNLKTPSPISAEPAPGAVKVTPERNTGSPESSYDESEEDEVEEAAATLVFASVPMAIQLFSSSKTNRIVVPKESITDEDIVGGRHSTGMKHPGTLAFQQEIADKWDLYQSFGDCHGAKSNLTKSILNRERNGRFIKKVKNGKYVLMTREEARSKVSQEFREETGRRNK